MRNMFTEFIPFSEKETIEIWKNARVVLDSSILLHVYEYAEKTREEFLDILRDALVIDRLWLPYKVAEEFHRNRLNVDNELEETYKKVVGILNSGFAEMAGNVRKVQIKELHPYVNKDLILEDIERRRTEALKWLEEQRIWEKNDISAQDPILETIYTIYDEKVSQDLDPASLKRIFEEGEKRYAKKIPPGYEDANKDERLRYGDLIVWKSLINEAKDSDKDVVFVTDDIKEDWWVTKGGKPKSPRPELIKEFQKETGRKIIICTSEEFFKRGNSLIGKTPSENSLTDINRAMSGWDFEDKRGWWQTDSLKKQNLTGLLLSGLKPSITTPAPSSRVTEKLEDAVETIVSWFLSNYKDPADGVPYDGREGGYQYFNGGPYYAEKEIALEFSEVPQEIIDAALSRIEPYGFEWVKNDEY